MKYDLQKFQTKIVHQTINIAKHVYEYDIQMYVTKVNNNSITFMSKLFNINDAFNKLLKIKQKVYLLGCEYSVNNNVSAGWKTKIYKNEIKKFSFDYLAKKIKKDLVKDVIVPRLKQLYLLAYNKLCATLNYESSKFMKLDKEYSSIDAMKNIWNKYAKVTKL